MMFFFQDGGHDVISQKKSDQDKVLQDCSWSKYTFISTWHHTFKMASARRHCCICSLLAILSTVPDP